MLYNRHRSSLEVVHLAKVLFACWGLGLLVLCLAEVHLFSIWRALAATLLGAVIVFVPMACLQGMLLAS